MLEQEREEVMWKRSLRQSLRQVYEQEKDLILQNKKISGSDDVLLAEDIEEVADFFRERLTEIEYKLAEISQEENQINHDINEVNRELEKLGRNTKLASSFVDVVLDASKAGNMLVEVSYMVNAAAWVPAYDVRAKDVDSPLDLVYNGRVIQYTEVDWSDVNLTLSTGNPAAGGVAPEQPLAPVPARASGLPRPSARARTISRYTPIKPVATRTKKDVPMNRRRCTTTTL